MAVLQRSLVNLPISVNDIQRYPMTVLYQSSQLVVVELVVHSIAILSTVFRLVYRSWTRHFWWEDRWAAFALILDGKFPCMPRF
ncbi:hypothetical protein AZE42_07820 [Rhizopogon vesiculosus]|uniref:Uncharacterized protein n=1 Tax=Rhizopogon vesiculosus TaxID=180088 RepID=A0A1J8Q6R5_9AGAM|nr:hypothetical protein AZE42_07820 [Rhizopogon vesiculosus]